MFVSVSLVRAVLDVMYTRGLSSAELAADMPWPAERLADMRTRLDQPELEHLLERALLLAKDPALGLRVGQAAPESIGQIVSHVALSAASLDDTFARFVRFSPLLFEGIEFTLARGAQRGELRYTLPRTLALHATRFFAEVLSTFLASLGARRFGRGTCASSFNFAYPRPDYASEYHAVLGERVRFEQPYFSYDFPLAWFEQPNVNADSLMNYELGHLAERLLQHATEPVTMVERVQTRLREIEPTNLDINALAKVLRMSVRVLRRRLAVEGASLTELRKLHLQETAVRELLRPEANIKDIADRLGYSEPSAFHRAFKRWTGHTPNEYVRQHRRGGLSERATAK